MPDDLISLSSRRRGRIIAHMLAVKAGVLDAIDQHSVKGDLFGRAKWSTHAEYTLVSTDHI